MNLFSYFVLPVIKRNQDIDILRSIALLGVIIAHCSPSDIIFQIRQFDVPLMVILSAISFSISYKKSDESWLKYCIKRVKRLIFPTWIFLTIYFILFHEVDVMIVLTSYLLVWGIGYVWIIRVFFAMAIFAPIMYKIYSKFKSAFYFWIVIFLLLCLNELIIYKFYNIINSDLIVKTLFVTIPYFIVYIVGLRLYNAKINEILVVAALFILLFITQAFYLFVDNGVFIHNHPYKYPPRIYYISYALGISFLLYAFKNKIVKFVYRVSIKLGNSMCWLAQHTLWIYFWHIVFVKITDALESSFIRFVLVLVGAVCCTYIQCLLVKFLQLRVKKTVINNNIRILFEG